jgi:hypothetical protein
MLRTTGVGHEDRFRRPTLSGRCRLGEPTFAGASGNEQDAPKAAVCGPEKDPNFLAQGRPLATASAVGAGARVNA